MKKSILAVGALFAAGLAFLLGSYWTPGVPRRGNVSATAESMSSFPRSLVLVVDQGEVYCGSDRAPKDAVGEYVYRTMRLNRADAVIIRGSDTTRYGDIAELAGKIRRRGVRIISVGTTSVATGTRLPVIDTQTLMSVNAD